MTDITTTAPAPFWESTIVLPPAPAVTDRRAGFSGELDRAREELAAAQREIAEKDEAIVARSRIIEQLRTDQITDGGDYRLTEFWERAGRIANHANFCEEYDRMAEAMNGPRRERDYDVTLRITVEWTTTRRAVDGDAAGDFALNDFDVTEIADEASSGMLTVIETEVYETVPTTINKTKPSTTSWIGSYHSVHAACRDKSGWRRTQSGTRLQR